MAGLYSSGGGLVGLIPGEHFQRGGLTEGSMNALGSQAHFGALNVGRELSSVGVKSGIKLVQSATPGRTDRIPMRARAGSFVLPADVVSGLGQGNTLAGAKMWGQAIAHSAGPYGTATTGIRPAHPLRAPTPRVPIPRSALPRLPRGPAFQGGGDVDYEPDSDELSITETNPQAMFGDRPFSMQWNRAMPDPRSMRTIGAQDGGDIDDGHTTILVAGGEVIVDPDYVSGIGGGDLEKGSKLLHKSVLSVRKQVGDNRKLPEPVR